MGRMHVYSKTIWSESKSSAWLYVYAMGNLFGHMMEIPMAWKVTQSAKITTVVFCSGNQSSWILKWYHYPYSP